MTRGCDDTPGVVAARPILHFAHAAGFPAGTYGVFFAHLREHYDVRALELHAHNPAYPVTDGWCELGQELINALVTDHDQPVILAGHSLGGLLCLLAAKARPELVRCVILLDAPVVAGWRALAFQLAKLLGTDKRFSPARVSEKRRTVWPDAAAAHKYFAMRKPFSAWHPGVLRDYVTHGFAPHPQGVTLRFCRETETAIYRTVPHHLGKLTRRPFPVPIGFIGGAQSVECRMAGSHATRRLVGRHFRSIEGSHLFPMESPVTAAAVLHEMVQHLLQHPD